MSNFIKTFCIFFLIVRSITYSYQIPINQEENSSLIPSSKLIDANDISAWIRNNGSLPPIIGPANFEWPKGTNKYAIYTSGLWLGCKIQDSIHLAISEYDSEFLPGYIIFNTQTPAGKDDSEFRIYKLSPLYPDGNSNFDSWSVWPVLQGAPWIDVNNNGVYEPPTDKPLMKGDQNLFCVFTDGYPESHNNNIGRTAPLLADIHLYSWANMSITCADVIFLEYKIINKRNTNWDSLIIGFWSDPDVGDAISDKGGSDSNQNLGFIYNDSNYDNTYGNHPPALGYLFYEASRHVEKIADVLLAPIKTIEEPRDYLESWRILKGLKPTTGLPWINPINNQPTKYMYTGNPESNTGWLDPIAYDKRLLASSYMGTIQPLDTLYFKLAIFIKRGLNHLNAVTQIKNCATQLIAINQLEEEIPRRFELFQNYPNPFNPITTIKFNVWKYSKVKIIIYDIQGRKVTDLINSYLKPGAYSIQWNAGNISSGIYLCSFETKDFIETKKMVLLK